MGKWKGSVLCIWHEWHKLGGEIGARVNEAVAGLDKRVAKKVQVVVRREIKGLGRAVMDADGDKAAREALLKLKEHRLGGKLARELEGDLDSLLVYRKGYNKGLARVSPEW